MSLKQVPFESSGAVSYSPSIVTMAESVAVCELFSVKACDPGNWVRGRSWLSWLTMAVNKPSLNMSKRISGRTSNYDVAFTQKQRPFDVQMSH